MSDLSLTISENAGLELIELVQDGRMTEATYMELRELPLNVKITSGWLFLDGLPNYLPNVKIIKRLSALSSIKKRASRIQPTNTQLSPSESSFNSLGKRGTSEIRYKGERFSDFSSKREVREMWGTPKYWATASQTTSRHGWD